ncbi:MAG: prepilin peptidase [Blautia sp.]|nr:prepilin peptidase [Blautia sp.]MCM1199919.1 prepilin peptidase [Bacteroides fragilis]
MFKMQVMTDGGNNIIEGIALIYMSVCMVFDIRRREIPLWLILFGMAAALGIDLWRIGEGAVTAAEMGLSLLPGIFFLLTGLLTGEKVGYGDGLLLLFAGLLLGAYRCFLALGAGLVFSAAVSLFLLLFRRADRNSRIPFVPFLVCGMGVVMFV